jgi:alcohol dehydrogenase YqhD (iron-dependent ADH family)
MKHRKVVIIGWNYKILQRNLKVMEERKWKFEQEPSDEPIDDTIINLRAYFDLMPDEKMQQYSKDWTDEEVMKWDDNFTDEDNLLLVCCFRDVEIDEYRKVLEQAIEYRNRIRSQSQETLIN